MKEALHLGLVFLLGLQGTLAGFNCLDGVFSADTIFLAMDPAKATGYMIKVMPDAGKYKITLTPPAGRMITRAFVGFYEDPGKTIVPGTVNADKSDKQECPSTKAEFYIRGEDTEVKSIEFTWTPAMTAKGMFMAKAIACEKDMTDAKKHMCTPDVITSKSEMISTTTVMPKATDSTAGPGSSGSTKAQKGGAPSLNTVVVPALVTVAAVVCLRKFPFLPHAVLAGH